MEYTCTNLSIHLFKSGAGIYKSLDTIQISALHVWLLLQTCLVFFCLPSNN